jgi:hypothetical protein
MIDTHEISSRLENDMPITNKIFNDKNYSSSNVKNVHTNQIKEIVSPKHGPAYVFKKQQTLKRQQMFKMSHKPKKYSNISSRYKINPIAASLINLNQPSNTESDPVDDHTPIVDIKEVNNKSVENLASTSGTTSEAKLDIVETDAKTITDSTNVSTEAFNPPGSYGEALIFKNNQIMFKDLKIDLNSNEINMGSHVQVSSRGNKIAFKSERSTNSKSKSTLERFFDKQIGFYEDSDESSNNHLNTESSLNSNDQSNTLSHSQRDSFIDNLFNSKPAVAEKSKNTRLKKRFSNADSDLVISLPKLEVSSTTEGKIRYLNNIIFQDESSIRLNLAYLTAYEVLNNPKVHYFITNRKLLVTTQCACLKNCLACCMKNLIKNTDPRSAKPESVADKCCSICLDFSNESYAKSEASFKALIAKYGYSDLISDLLDASSILNNEIYRKFISSFSTSENNLLSKSCFCAVAPNFFKCCIETIYDHAQSFEFNKVPDKLPESLLSSKCCLNCHKLHAAMPQNMNSDQLDVEVKQAESNKNTNFWGTFFIDHEEEDETPRAEMIQGQVENDKKNASDLPLVENIPDLVLEPSATLSKLQVTDISTPPPLILSSKAPPLRLKKSSPKFVNFDLKKPTTKNRFVSNKPLNPNRKSFTFIQDSKYGFMQVEIPDWQDKLREPVYSSKSTKNLPEWRFK